VIRDASRGEGATDLARTLEEQREALKTYEGTALAQLAESLARAADVLAQVQERQEKMTRQEWMNHEECAKHLRRSPDALYRLVASGEIPAHKVAGKNLYNVREVDAAAMRL
jgi:hypothetical protein